MADHPAKAHIEEAYKLLTGEAFRIGMEQDAEPEKIEGMCVLVIELQRIDCALGPKGHSMFAGIADKIQAAYVEITAAREALKNG